MIAPRRTVQWLFSTLYRPQKLIGAKPKTIEQYQRMLVFFDRYHNGCADVENMQPGQVANYLAWRQAGERAPETAKCCDTDYCWAEGTGPQPEACSICSKSLDWQKPF